jgi:selT/selW/selH-like putative selenoprotein
LPRASRAEEEIKEAFSDAKVTLTAGERGAFEVELNGKLIFSKLYKVGTFIERFPDSGELVRLIKKEIEK